MRAYRWAAALCLLLAMAVLPGKAEAAGNGFSGGTGTVTDPYLIATAEDLAAMSSGGASACYLQTADIDLSGMDSWKQITLSGTYDGGGYRILNLKSSTGGLFDTNSGTIRNVTLEGALVSTNSQSRVGGLVNTNTGYVENCVFSGVVIGYCGSGSNIDIGGIVGRSDGTNERIGQVSNCVVKAGSSIVSNAAADADDVYVGGIIGELYNGTAKNCLNEGTVYINTEGADIRCGGVVGHGYWSSVSACGNTGDVVGPGKTLGGVVGYSTATYVVTCYNRGDIGGEESSAEPSKYPWQVNAIGGLAGNLSKNNVALLQNSYNTGAVSGTESNSDVGTLIGRGTTAVGETTVVTRSYWLEGSGLEPVGFDRKEVLTECEELSQAEMQSLDMVEKLNQGLSTPAWYYDVQNINDGYPVLEWQLADLCVQADVEQGMYVDPFAVTLTSPAGGQIWYTLDGSDPRSSASRTAYTEPVFITADCTLKTYAAYEPGNSPVSSFAYQVAEYPVLPSQPAGVYYTYLVGLTLSCPGASDAVIYYTTDGSDPTSSYSYSRKVFSGPIHFVENTTLKVVAQVNGSYGDVLEYKYVITPVITASDPGGAGVYDAPISVTLTSSLEQYQIYYTLDGTDPKAYGTAYTGPIAIGGTAQLKAVGRYGSSWGEVYTFSYTFPEPEITAGPSYPLPENYSFYLKISCTPDYLDIYTDINGEFERYTGEYDVPIYQTTQLTVQLRYGEQVVKSQVFTYELPELDFQLSPPPGTPYNSRITVELNCPVYGIILRYSLDGSDPVLSSLGGISHPGHPQEIPLDRSCTLRVVAMWESSQEPLLEKSYTYTLNIPGVKASQSSGEYDGPFDLTLSVTGTSDPLFYQILYTTDGSDPMEFGQVYSDPIHVDRTVTIRAIPQFTLDKSFGTESRLEYKYNQFVSLGSGLTLYDDSGSYYVAADLTSNFPDPKQVELWAALYNEKGRMVDAGRLGEADLTAYQTSPVRLKLDFAPRVNPMDESYDLKVFALERETMAPLNQPQTPQRVEIPKLESITVGKSVYEVWLGAYGDYIQVTGHYTAGKSDASISAASCQFSSDNPDVAYVESGSGIIRFGQEGSAIITVTYTENGHTATAYVYVVVSIPVYSAHPLVPDYGVINHYSPILVEEYGYVYDLPSEFSAIENYLRLLERMGFSYQPSISDPANGQVYYMTSRVVVQITMLDGSLYIIIDYNPYI